MDGLAWPSWSATWRGVRQASSRRVATVFRKVWDVTHDHGPLSQGSGRLPEPTLTVPSLLSWKPVWLQSERSTESNSAATGLRGAVRAAGRDRDQRAVHNLAKPQIAEGRLDLGVHHRAVGALGSGRPVIGPGEPGGSQLAHPGLGADSRTAAALAHEGGAPLKDIADQLGHADPAMTARVYLGRDPFGEGPASGICSDRPTAPVRAGSR